MQTTLGKPVLQISRETGRIIKMHRSAHQAAKALGLSASKISAVCRGSRNSTGGFSFKLACPLAAEHGHAIELNGGVKGIVSFSPDTGWEVSV